MRKRSGSLRSQPLKLPRDLSANSRYPPSRPATPPSGGLTPQQPRNQHRHSLWLPPVAGTSETQARGVIVVRRGPLPQQPPPTLSPHQLSRSDTFGSTSFAGPSGASLDDQQKQRQPTKTGRSLRQGRGVPSPFTVKGEGNTPGLSPESRHQSSPANDSPGGTS